MKNKSAFYVKTYIYKSVVTNYSPNFKLKAKICLFYDINREIIGFKYLLNNIFKVQVRLF